MKRHDDEKEESGGTKKTREVDTTGTSQCNASPQS